MKTVKVNITFPVVVGARDYHEFSDYKDLLKKITGKPVKYIEIQSELEEIWEYEADPSESKKLVSKLRKRLTGVDVDELLKRKYTPYCAVFYV